jgi:hypothetical protein
MLTILAPLPGFFAARRWPALTPRAYVRSHAPLIVALIALALATDGCAPYPPIPPDGGKRYLR